MKDHEIREFVNQLLDIAVTYGHTQQLRERIVHLVAPILQAEDCRIAMLEGKCEGLMTRIEELLKTNSELARFQVSRDLQVRYMRPDTRKWTANQISAFGLFSEECRNSPLYAEGDAVLVWVNEGDILRNGRLVEKPKDEPALVSYAPDYSTCTLAVNGKEMYYDKIGEKTKLNLKLPSNAAEIRDFIGHDFIETMYALGEDHPSDEDKYILSGHDLLSAFMDWKQRYWGDESDE